METVITVVNTMQVVLTEYGAFVVVIATFLFGENAALATFALSADGYIHPLKAILFVFIGSMLADLFWFIITEYTLRRRCEKYLAVESKNETEKLFMRLIDSHFFLVLIFIKFLIGMRLFLTIYIILKNKIPFYKLAMLNAFSTLLFITVIFPMGWFFGKGFSSVMLAGNWLIKMFSVLVFMVIFVNLLSKIIIFVMKKYALKSVLK